MAILLVRIEDPSAIPFNEFFDYNGRCYGISRSRLLSTDNCLDPEDFYEGSAGMDCLKQIPVLFLIRSEDGGEASGPGNSCRIIGWYRQADIYPRILRPSLFLEGNLCAASRDAVLLPGKGNRPADLVDAEKLLQNSFLDSSKLYEVVEAEDARSDILLSLIKSYRGANAMLRYPFVQVSMIPSARRDYESCIGFCRDLAERLMQNECRDLSDVKLLESYAKQAALLNSGSADGSYYLAMAQYQLGFTRSAVKAIEKALKLEPDASDLMALKAEILVSMGYRREGAAAFEQAYSISGEEDYLLMEGRTLLMEGLIAQGYEVFRRIKNQELLRDAGIDPQDLDKKWPFLKIRGIRWKDFFRRK